MIVLLRLESWTSQWSIRLGFLVKAPSYAMLQTSPLKPFEIHSVQRSSHSPNLPPLPAIGTERMMCKSQIFPLKQINYILFINCQLKIFQSSPRFEPRTSRVTISDGDPHYTMPLSVFAHFLTFLHFFESWVKMQQTCNAVLEFVLNR